GSEVAVDSQGLARRDSNRNHRREILVHRHVVLRQGIVHRVFSGAEGLQFHLVGDHAVHLAQGGVHSGDGGGDGHLAGGDVSSGDVIDSSGRRASTGFPSAGSALNIGSANLDLDLLSAGDVVVHSDGVTDAIAGGNTALSIGDVQSGAVLQVERGTH